MKSKVFLAVAVVLMCLVLVAQSALAQPQDRGSRQGRGSGQSRGGMGRGGSMYEGLDLTEEQQAKIAKIREEIMEKVRNADSSEARREVYGQMREKMQAILTPEQREKLAKQREEMAQRFSGRRGREGDRPGGDRQRSGRDASRTRSMGPIQVLDGLLRRLGLNEEQKKKIARIRAEAIKKLFKDVKAVLTKEQNTKFAEDQKRVRTAQQRRSTEARPDAGGPPREGGSRRGSGDRDGGSRGRSRSEGGRDREN